MNEHVAIDVSSRERIEIVRSAERLAAVAPAWMDLWHRIDGPVFQSHAWVAAWWETVGDREQRELRIGLVWNGDRLVAVMPMAISRRKGLRFLEWAAGSYTDYGDILAAPECSTPALQRLWKQLSATGGFDLAFLNRLVPDAAARRLVEPEISSGIKLRLNHRQEVSYRVAGQWKSGAAWYEALSKKTRKSFRHGCNTIEKSGNLQFRLLSPDEPVEPVLKRLAVLKTRWLEERGGESELFDQDAPVLAALVAVLARTGVLRIFVLECDGVIIAVSVNFVQHGSMMAWLTTYDPDFSAASPGLILMMEYIKWSFDHDLQMVDFLCGGEAFKERFATLVVTLQSFLGIHSLKGGLAFVADRTREAIRARQSRRSVKPDVAEAQADVS